MQPHELLQSPWPSFNVTNSPFFNEFGDCGLAMDTDMNRHDFDFCPTPPFFTTDNSVISGFSTIFPDEFSDLSVDIALPGDDLSISVEDFDVEVLSESLEQSEDDFDITPTILLHAQNPITILSHEMEPITPIHTSLTLPTQEMGLDNQLGTIHLVKAYGEAIDEEQTELSEVIMKRISEKVSLVGGVMDRLFYYLFQPLDKQADYLKQESGKSFLAAFMAFYQIFPFGKFAHFAANQAILQAMPHDAELIHIIDCDMREGIQWASMIEAIGRQQRAEIRLTSVKWSEGDSNSPPSPWRFAETKGRLCDHARAFGLKLTVDTMELHDLVNEMKTKKRNGGRREWLVFNCMVGLPHMGRARSRRDVSEFLRAAKGLLAYIANCNSERKILWAQNPITEFGTNFSYGGSSIKPQIGFCAPRRTDFDDMGIIAFGDGDAWMNSNNSSSFGSFLDGNLVHYQALLESIEWAFPNHLVEARTALECLFVAPLVSSLAWFDEWKEMECCDLQLGFGLEGWQVSKESLLEAMEMVREGESQYGVRIEGENNNSMVLEWRRVPLLRVSCWTS